MKYSWEFKLECVEEYLKGRWKEKPEYAKCSDLRFHHSINEWVRTYKLHGVEGLKHVRTSKDWTTEERYELIVRVLAGETRTSVAFDAGINPGLLYQWIRKYRTEGYDGLKLRKGRKPKGPVMSIEDRKLTGSEKEELILLRKQNEYLKAENAYLKKFRALIVRKKAESSVKAKKQPSSKGSEQKDTD